MKTLTKERGVPHAKCFDADYEWVKEGRKWTLKITIPGQPAFLSSSEGAPRLTTLRKTITKNYSKLKERKKRLKKAVKEGKVSTWSCFWWAKFWRKLILLEMLAKELEKNEEWEPMPPGYEMTNKERREQILDAVKQSKEAWSKFAPLFEHIPIETYAYAVDSFKEFKESLEEDERPTKIPRRFLNYFDSNSAY